MASTDMAEKTKTRNKVELAKPSMYNVIYMNDDVTTMEFVVLSLIEIFNHTVESANELTMKVHEEGSAVVAVLPYELAEQKGVEATVLARQNGFPLMIKLEAVI